MQLLIKKNITNYLFLISLFIPMIFILFKMDINIFFAIGILVFFDILLFKILAYFRKINKKNSSSGDFFKNKTEKILVILIFFILGWFNFLGWFTNIFEIKEIDSAINLIVICLNFVYLFLHIVFLIFFFFLLNTGKLNE